MYTRSERKFIEPNRATNDRIGPGCYTADDATKAQSLARPLVSASSAPFSSITPRVSYFDEVARNSGPAPNLFDVETRHEYRKALPFGASKTPRFVEPAARSPGPNAYCTETTRDVYPDRLLVTQQLRDAHDRDDGISWKRKFMPPSIPYGSQAGGYDEDGEGNLLPRATQSAPDPAAALLGHGDFIRASAGTSFSKSQTRRHSWKPAATPGPGVYNVASAWKAFKDKRLESQAGAGDATPCVRFGDYVISEANRRAVPGPGSYDVAAKCAADRNRGPVMSKSQNRSIAPTSDPFSVQAGPGAAAAAVPGPAAYDVVHATQPRKPLHVAMKPFNSSSARFAAAALAASAERLPGPGRYDVPDAMAKAARKPATAPAATAPAGHAHQHGRTATAAAAFGSVSSRFADTERSLAPLSSTPGPASYAVAEGRGAKKPRGAGPMHVFHYAHRDGADNIAFGTKQGRFVHAAAEAQGPMPGAYNVAEAYAQLNAKGKHHRVAKPVYIRTEMHRHVDPDGDDDDAHVTPGPMDYNPSLPSSNKPVAAAVFKSKQPRLLAPKHNHPAPNAFKGHDTLVRKTYNVTLEGDHHRLGASVATALNPRVRDVCAAAPTHQHAVSAV